MEQSTQGEARPFNFRHDSLELAGDVWGPEPTVGGDAPVVLLHGGGQTRHSWDRTARRLAADGRTAITVDARGHGDSDWDPDGDYSRRSKIACSPSVG